jgi:hypothetical protein
VNTAADLDLSAEVVYAINFGDNGNPQIGGVVFSQDQDHPNVSVDTSAEGAINTWGGVYPNTGDPDLDMLLGGIIWKNSTKTGRTTSVTIADALIIGMSYQLQLIFYTDHYRPMDIIVEGNTIVERYDPFPAQGNVAGKGGSVVKCVFAATDTTLHVAAKSNPDIDASLLSGLILTKHWPPLPDFNGDWRIDIEDLVILIEHWGKSEASLDLAPPPAGDGVVDAQDLAVFMSYWGQELNDPSLLAHWALDETEGNIAHDSAGKNDASMAGMPAWQPAGGKVGGALAFDGMDDLIPTSFVLSPAQGPFSVFAWVKGGAPGQVVISQALGADWLCANPTDGSLMTNLISPGRSAQPGLSGAVITDGQWHRIGLVWDETTRFLYVDGRELAKDAMSKPPDWRGTLTIGAGKTLAPGTLWSGLIDDVRIYNRVVQP